LFLKNVQKAWSVFMGIFILHSWKAKCPIFKAIVAGFRGKVATKIGHLAFQIYTLFWGEVLGSKNGFQSVCKGPFLQRLLPPKGWSAMKSWVGVIFVDPGSGGADVEARTMFEVFCRH